MKMTELIAGAAIALLFAGCGETQQTDNTTVNTPRTNGAATDLGSRVQQAADSTRQTLSQSKDQFVSTMNSKLKDWDQKLGDLGQKTGSMAGDAKTQANKALDTLREKRDAASTKFAELKKSSQDAWQAAKTNLDSALADLQQAYENAKSKFEK